MKFVHAVFVFFSAIATLSPAYAGSLVVLNCGTPTLAGSDVAPASTPQTLRVTHADESHGEVTWKSPAGTKKYAATFVVQEASVFGSTTEYTLTHLKPDEVPHLSVSRYQFFGRGGCGRGGCNNPGVSIVANLETSEGELNFSCHELDSHEIAEAK